jgi:hypothetical protein
VIDDGISPIGLSIPVLVRSDDVEYDVDPSDASSIALELMNYIITLKFPSAIYECDEFFNEDFYKFSKCSGGKYNTEKYLFAEANGYVYCWLIDYDSWQQFFGFIDRFCPNSVSEVLHVFVGMAYACGRMDTAFFSEDLEFAQAFAASSANSKKEFHNEFQNDPDTVLVPRDKKADNSDIVVVHDLEELQSKARELITQLTGESYFDDDEPDNSDVDFFGDSTGDDTDEDSEDDGYDDPAEALDNMDLSEESKPEEEKSDSIDRVNTSDDDNFTIPVIHKTRR